jgi:hypothetical protein
VFLSVLLAWGFTKHLSQIYAREQDAAARARRAAEAKEDLLGVVAHDLRTPLGAILLNAALIDRAITEPKTHRHAESIAAIATRMEAFIQKLLDAASIEAGRLVVSWTRCAVSDLLAATMDTFGALAGQRSVTLDREIGRGDLGFWGDPERNGQVLSNLVGNALKFTPEGGRITIRAVESGFHTRIEVRDTGPGIASQHLPRVFERFWKADAEGRKGTGLGLCIAKGIVERHRGRIWVESRVGAGSAFIFELPIALHPSRIPRRRQVRPTTSRRLIPPDGPRRGTWRASSSLDDLEIAETRPFQVVVFLPLPFEMTTILPTAGSGSTSTAVADAAGGSFAVGGLAANRISVPIGADEIGSTDIGAPFTPFSARVEPPASVQLQ